MAKKNTHKPVKKKKPVPVKKKPVKKPKLNKAQKKAIGKAKYQVKKYQDKLDQKRLPLEEKYALEKELRKYKKKAGIKHVTKREKERSKKEKNSISSQRSRIKKKLLSGDLSKAEYNKLRKKYLSLNRRLGAINKTLGIKKRKKKADPIVKEPGIVQITVPVWVVRTDYLEPLQESPIMKHAIMSGRKFNIKRKWADILMAWYEMEVEALSSGDTTPYVSIGIDVKNKVTSFDL